LPVAAADWNSFGQSDAAILAVEKEAARLANMKTWTETFQSNSEKILEEVRKMTSNLEKQVAVLRDSVEVLRQE
jgi:biotin-(acetyl-CoA carboxylase) ligase